MPSLTMSPQLYVLFSTLVEETSGVLYGPQDQELFASKVADHAMEQGFESLLDFYYRLRYDDRDGLVARGIDVSAFDRRVVRRPHQPQAFPVSRFAEPP